MNLPEPVFVLAPARSYSSVVTAMIGSHPQLLGLPELALIGYPTVGDAIDHKVAAMRAKGYRAVTAPGLAQAVAELVFGGQGDAQVTAALQWLEERRTWPPHLLIDVLREHAAPCAIVEQSPETVMSTSGLDMLGRDYPNASVIHLVRHPVTAVESMVRFWQDWPAFAGDDGRWQRALLLWTSQHQRIAQFLQGRGSAITMRAEDVLNSHEVLREVCTFLEIDDSPIAIDLMSSADSPFVGEVHPDLRGAMDPGFVAASRPRSVPAPEVVQFPREWNIDPFVQMGALACARELGYLVD